ncbi:MAG: glucose-1-phosphate cytidylyltransferase [Halobacteriota archaeon]|jgi:glucose-1-phosphate cytidylyltransferase
MKTVILCGGKGTRLREETEFRPKPMVRIGNKPILWHIMKTYSSYGFNDFVICLGYKGEMIKEYFLNYKIKTNDFTIRLGDPRNLTFHNDHSETDWTITFAETGEEAETGTRVKKIEKYITDDCFMLTYGDGVASINLQNLVDYHKSHGKIGTITGVHPSSRFGEFILDGNQVVEFSEKPQTKEGLINGGYFVFDKQFFKYLSEDEHCFLEREPLMNLASDGQLMIYKHYGFWQCVDTYRELEQINAIWASPNPPWRIWG